MGQRDGFAGGFLAGAMVGGVVGGIIGAIVANRRDIQLEQEEESTTGSRRENRDKVRSRQRIAHSEKERMDMETTRRSLEDKIAQLNATIDEVQQQLGNVNSTYNQKANEKVATVEE